MRLIRSFLVLPLALLAACDLGTEPERDLPPLATQVWTAATVGGTALPMVVAQRQLEGNVLEYDILDELYVTIDTAGTWTQRAYLRRFRDGDLHEELLVDADGTWAAEPSGYIFATYQSELGFIIPNKFEDSFSTTMWIDGVTPGIQVRMVKGVN